MLIICQVLRPRFRQLVALLASLGVLGLVVLPAEHVHLSHGPGHHDSDIIHRHFEPHHDSRSDFSFSEDEQHIQWTDSSFASPSQALQTTCQQPLLYQVAPDAEQRPTCERAVRIDDLAVHEPPALTRVDLRGPPFSACLA